MSNEKIASRVRKLLAIAGDEGASEQEIQNAMNFANRLIEQHHLSEDDLSDEVDPVKDLENAELGKYASFIGKKCFRWESLLAQFVADFVGCRVYRNNTIVQARRHDRVLFDSEGQPYEGKSFHFYGVAEDCLIAAEIYDELRQLICSMAVLRYGGMYKGDGGKYSEGFVAGLRSQMNTARDKTAQEATGTGLIVVQKRNEIMKVKQALAVRYLREEGLRLSSSQGSRGARGSYSAYNRGFSDGQNTSVNGTRRKKLT